MASCLRDDGVGVGGSLVFIKICKLFNDHHHMGVYSSLFEIFLGEYHCNYKDFRRNGFFAYFFLYLKKLLKLNCLYESRRDFVSVLPSKIVELYDF